MKIPVNMENYPALLEYLKRDKEGFLKLMKGLFQMADAAAKRGDLDAAKEYFKTTYEEVVREVMDGFFDTAGILSNHGEPHAKQLFKVYGHQLHPLYAALTDEKLEDRDGNVIPFHEKFGTESRNFNIKHWIQSLLFWSYYCDMKDMAKAFSLNNLVLAEQAKKRFFARLHEIQPALELQQKNGKSIGSLIPGTGLFDVGIPADDIVSICLACKRKGTIYEVDEAKACSYCSAGYRKGKSY